ncbi:MAG: NosD domain-containing protein [Halobacteriaceae archaeon]
MLARGVIAVAAGLLLVASVSLAVPAGVGGTEPVRNDEMLTLGLTETSSQRIQAADLALPRVQVYYSGYEYVVRFHSVASFVTEQRRTGHDRQFGSAIAVFVTDFTGTGVNVTDDGYLSTARAPGYVRADDASLVVGSEARLPGTDGPVAVPFGSRGAAAAFADAHGGTVLPWVRGVAALDPVRPLSTPRFEDKIDRRTAWADRTVAAARTLRDRPVSVVVGEDAPTLAAAVAAAPPNTTVHLPPGTYDADRLVVDKPVTIDGVGTASRIHGDGNGTVVVANASRVGVTDLRIDGVGSVGSRGRAAANATPTDDGWSRSVELAYGRGDAALRLVGANASLVSGVTIDTPSNGIIALGSRGATVRNLTLNGTTDLEDGFMGVVAMYEPMVVEDSRFRGGLDAVYTHRAHGIVIRDNRMSGGRYGVHEMYTSDVLVSNNTVRDEYIGIILMTRPSGNLVVGNDVRDSRVGLSTAGTDSYFARNVLAANQRGIDLLGYRSLYRANTVVGNGVGMRGASGLPTNLVTANDVVANGRPAAVDLGALRVWTVRGAGNYWGPLPSTDGDADGYYDRAFRPTAPVDGRVHDVVGAWTLAASPAMTAVRGVQSAVPGLRSGGVVDAAPRVGPTRPAVLARVRANVSEVSA